MSQQKVIEVPQRIFKQVGGWATVFTVVAITYYILGGYKYFLEINDIKKNNNGTNSN